MNMYNLSLNNRGFISEEIKIIILKFAGNTRLYHLNTSRQQNVKLQTGITNWEVVVRTDKFIIPMFAGNMRLPP
jgi:hypothetical protein